MSSMYILEAYLQGYEAELYLNEALMAKTTPDIPKRQIMVVNEWLKNGENLFRVAFKKVDNEALEKEQEALQKMGGPKPFNERDEPPYVRCEVTLREKTLANFSDDSLGNLLAEFKWEPPVAGPVPIPSQQVWLHPVQHDWGVWSWEKADIVTLTPSVLQELVHYVTHLFNLIAASDLDGLLKEMEVKLQEFAACYGKTLEEVTAMTRAGLAETLNAQDFILEPLDFTKMAPRLCCGGRVVELLYQDDKPILRSPTEWGPLYTLSVYVAQVNKTWKIIR